MKVEILSANGNSVYQDISCLKSELEVPDMEDYYTKEEIDKLIHKDQQK